MKKNTTCIDICGAADKLTIEAAAKALVAILSVPNAGDVAKVAACETLTKIGSIGSIGISNCNFTAK